MKIKNLNKALALEKSRKSLVCILKKREHIEGVNNMAKIKFYDVGGHSGFQLEVPCELLLECLQASILPEIESRLIKLGVEL